MFNTIHPVLLCGDSGTRLWPLSRKPYPKQFVKLIGEESLSQASARRLSGKGYAAPTIVTGVNFRFIIVEQLAAIEISPSDILIEPTAKNTAAAICAAALGLNAREPDAPMLVSPSNHVIPDYILFHDSVLAAVPAAKAGQLVTFGIRSDRPKTGYGWLELSTPTPDFAPVPQVLQSFVEKPTQANAEQLLANGMHLWNAGIFLFSTTAILNAFDTHAPEVLSGTRASFEVSEKVLSFTRLAPQPWTDIPSISIDYAMMEQANNLMVVPYSGEWSDLGDWEAVWRESEPDASGVKLSGSATRLSVKTCSYRPPTRRRNWSALALRTSSLWPCQTRY